MAWARAINGEVYDGETHELAGVTYTGKTRTPLSQRLVWIDTPEPTPPSKQKVAETKRKPSVSKRTKSK